MIPSNYSIAEVLRSNILQFTPEQLAFIERMQDEIRNEFPPALLTMRLEVDSIYNRMNFSLKKNFGLHDLFCDVYASIDYLEDLCESKL